MSGWIVVTHWDRYQHPDAARSSVPPWIKLYTDLLSDEAYVQLTPARRAMFVGLLVEYAKTRRKLPENTATLSRRLAQRVARRDLEALNHAGLIGFVASKPASNDASTPASLEKRREEVPPYPLASEGDQNGSMKCKQCGETVLPGKRCKACGATPRQAGSSMRELSKPKPKSDYERAETFTRNVGPQYEDREYADELARFDLSDELRVELFRLRDALRTEELPF